MTSTIIEFHDSEFVSALASVRRIADDLARQRATACRRVDALLDGGWSGPAATAYADRYAEWQVGAGEVEAGLARIAVAMEVARRELLSTDTHVEGDLTPLTARIERAELIGVAR